MNMQEKTEQALRRLLETGDEADRCYAARTLGAMGSAASLDALIKRLIDEDIDVCVDAAEALGRLGDLRAIPALIESLQNDQSGEVCAAVVRALGALGGEDAIAALMKVAKERPEGLDWEGDWDTWWDVQLAAVRALGEHGVEEATPLMLDIMDSDETQDIDAAIFTALSKIKGTGVDALLERLRSGRPLHRRRAAIALGRSGENRVAKALGKALLDEASEVRAATALALAELGEHRYLSALLLLLRDKSEEVRSAAVEACRILASQGTSSEDLNQAFIELVSDPSPQVRTIVFETLAATIEPDTLDEATREFIEDNLTEKDFNAATAACDLLGSNGSPASIDALIATIGDPSRYAMVRQHALLALGQIGENSPRVIDALKEAIFDEEQGVRLAALDTLTLLSEVPAPLASGSETDEPEEAPTESPLDIVMAAILGNLQRTANETPSETASQVVEFDPGETAQAEATSAEDMRPSDEEALPLPDEPGRVVQKGEVNAAVSTLEAIALDNAEVALGVHEPEQNEEIDDEIEDYLKVIEENNRVVGRTRMEQQDRVEDDVRRLGVRVLIGRTEPRAIDVLIHALNDEDDRLRREAALAIAETARRNPELPGLMNAIGSLITQLAMGGDEQRLACARALGRLRNRSALLPLLNALDEESTLLRIETVDALSNVACDGLEPDEANHMVTHTVSPVTVLRKIVPLLENPESGVRLAAARAVVKLLELEELQDYRDEILQRLIATGYLGAGAQARQIGKLLRTLDVSSSASSLLADLERKETSAERRFVIEMLEELFTPLPSAAGGMV